MTGTTWGPRLGVAAVAMLLIGCALAPDRAPPAPDELAHTVHGASTDAGTTPIRTVHVDRNDPQASDDNPGTAGRPLETIGKAAALAQANQRAGIGTRVVIDPGVYRESIELTGDGAETAAPIIFEASGEGVVVSGSDVWGGWQKQAGDLFAHAWPYRWGLAPIPPEWQEIADALTENVMARRREMIFVDGRSLTQVLSRDELFTQPGSFYVSEEEGLVFLRPPLGVPMGTAKVEVAVRPHLFLFEGMSNVTVHGLTFTHANTQLNAGHALAFVDGSSDILVEDCRIIWNNTSGMGFANDRDVTVRRNVANHNGIGGFEAYRVTNLLMEDNVTSFNNWRGYAGDFVDWASGQKLSGLRGATIVGQRAVGNLTHGFWLDYDNANVLIRGMVARNNLLDGLVLEASQGPTRVEDSRFCGNRRGIMSEHAEGVDLRWNTLSDNREWGILITGNSDGPRAVTDWETGQVMNLISRDWSLRSNVVTGTTAQQLLIGTSLSPAGSWETFVDTLDSQGNTWRNPDTKDAFGVAGWVRVDFAGWKEQTGQDSSSRFDSGALDGACALAPHSQGGAA
ncbi:MAG: right-handed parallel beta-helix repeat-containing protein [Actinomycetota bacterium]|nr:right-handed parallel beta-helix repeat-containing protein [Actinomycetota bacterium]